MNGSQYLTAYRKLFPAGVQATSSAQVKEPGQMTRDSGSLVLAARKLALAKYGFYVEDGARIGADGLRFSASRSSALPPSQSGQGASALVDAAKRRVAARS